MKKYYIKTLFHGWKEVTQERQQEYIKHLRNGIMTMTEEKKEAYIKTRVKTIDLDPALVADIEKYIAEHYIGE